jgi:hypothetical protein
LKAKAKRFAIRLNSAGKLYAALPYTLREVCLCIEDRHALTDEEISQVDSLEVGENFSNEDLKIRRTE